MRKLYLLQNVEMAVLSNNEPCIGGNGTINKLIIVGICRYHIKTITYIYFGRIVP